MPTDRNYNARTLDSEPSERGSHLHETFAAMTPGGASETGKKLSGDLPHQSGGAGCAQCTHGGRERASPGDFATMDRRGVRCRGISH